jgi:hypothetical protein
MAGKPKPYISVVGAVFETQFASIFETHRAIGTQLHNVQKKMQRLALNCTVFWKKSRTWHSIAQHFFGSSVNWECATTKKPRMAQRFDTGDVAVGTLV